MPTFSAAKAEDPTAMERNGFTLVELMIVIAVMALLASAVVLTAGSTGGGPQEAATRFASRLAAARDEAVLTGRPMSAWVSPSGYGFDRFQQGRWERLDVRPFQGGDWGRDVALSLAGEQARSRIRFDSLGLPDQPLQLSLSRDGAEANVRVAANGDVSTQ
jgi:general secretion pathway protein H